MTETSSSSQWDLITNSRCFARTLHKFIPERSNVRIDSARSYKALDKKFIFVTMLLIIIVIARATSSPAQASVEDAGTGDSVSDYDKALFDLPVDSTPNVESGASVTLDDVFIPATVWSLDTSTVHLHSTPSEASTDFGAALESDLISDNSWTQWIGGLWTNSYKASGKISFSWLLFGTASFSSLPVQVASCSGNSAERSNPASCDINSDHKKKADSHEGTFEENGDGNTVDQDGSATATGGSNSPSASSQESQPPVQPDLFSAVPAPRAFWHHWRQVLSTPPVDDPITSVDDPSVSPIDDPVPIDYDEASVPPPSDPVISVGAPWPVSDPLPIFTPPPESAIPETSTWIMLMIGFCTTVLVVHRNNLNSTKKRVMKAPRKFS